MNFYEDFLKEYPGAIVLISHDRTFLDNVTNRTIEISKGKIYDYKFSYTKYIVQRESEIERQEREAKNQQKYIEDTEKLINKFRAKKDKAAFAQTLIRKLEKLEKVEVDDFDGNKVRISFPPSPHAGKIIMTGNKLGKAYGDLRLFSGLDMEIVRGEKIALVGKNGVGKSTLVRMIVNKETHEGEMKPGYSVQLGYYAQNQADSLDMEKTVFQTIDDEAVGDMRRQVRSLLGSFLFSGDDVDKKVKVLSGGEKARLAFCKLLLQPYNFLVLDEPTNHLDLASKEVLKQALMKFDGTMLVVSHDRDFLDGLTQIVYEIKSDGLRVWPGLVKDFLKEKKAETIAQFERNKVQTRTDNTQSKVQPKVATPVNDKETEKLRKKLQTQLQKTEGDIARIEEEIIQMDDVVASLDYSDAELSKNTLDKYSLLKSQLDEAYSQWETIGQQISEL